MQPKFIIHGGLGRKPKSVQRKDEMQAALHMIAERTALFLQNHTALETAVYAVSLLEDNPHFNAGTGSKLQSDGIIRMSASVMDGERQRFAGVINIREIKNPVQVAARLLTQEDRVLAGEEALIFAHAQGFPTHNPLTTERRLDYEKKQKGQSGTVGCVVLDAQGRLAAATSTGGKGFEIPGRVSDSATIAGNYANAFAAVSCTGIGEDIVDAALAARIVLRVTDGMGLSEACERSVAEVGTQAGFAGVIALDVHGNMHQAAVSPHLAYIMHGGRISSF